MDFNTVRDAHGHVWEEKEYDIWYCAELDAWCDSRLDLDAKFGPLTEMEK